jgi:hypothetical protein
MSIQSIQPVFPFELGPISTDLKAAARLQLDGPNSVAGAGGAHTTAAPFSASAPSAPSLDVKNLYSALDVGLKVGFVAPGQARVMKTLADFQKPNSGITPGEMFATVMSASAEAALGDVMAKVSNKVAESLQSIVVKQS